jgi:carbon monoxide dehydrogenase subunit G
MHITDSFVVPVDIETAWEALLDVERVAPCMPGATLQSFDGDAFTGTVAVKLGALSMKYQGKGRFLERDLAGRRVAFEASGREARGSGTASATVTATLSTEGEQTRVDVDTELNVGGRAAQFGRSVMNEVASRLLGQFAASLAEQLTAGPAEAAVPDAAAPDAAESTDSVAPAPAAQASTPARHAEPIDLMDLGRQVMLKRAVGPLAVLAGVLIGFALGRRSGRRH